MPSRNTRFARQRGYSDIKQMARNGGKSKNFGVWTGHTVDSAGAREASGRHAYSPSHSNNAHWGEWKNGRWVKKFD